MQIDLHCHSRVSDGLLSPTELVHQAKAAGVRMLALTDHDETAGLAEAEASARDLDLILIRGTEISVSWRRRTLHIVGLNINPSYPPLQAGLATVRAGRAARAHRIAAALAEHGIENAWEGARKYAANPDMIGRSHFARYLVEIGRAKNVKSVFKKFLTGGKPGHVTHQWAELHEAVAWIRDSGGQAVLAHPGRYDMGPDTLRDLITEFKELGGEGMEVVTGSHSPDQYPVFARLCQEYGLVASCGSDFHGPGESYMGLGRLPPLPAGLPAIWHTWPQYAALR